MTKKDLFGIGCYKPDGQRVTDNLSDIIASMSRQNAESRSIIS